MAKVLLINPVVREEDVPRHIPYGIALLAAIAIKDGHQVQIYDANAHRKGFDILEQVYLADEWDVIGIGGLTTTYGYIKRAIALARKVVPDILLVAGGGFITSMPLDIMRWNPGISLGVIGEAFETFPEILDKIDRNDRDFSKTLGVVYRKADGESSLNKVRPLIADIDTLPWPAWELFPMDIYFANSSNLFSEEGFTATRRIDLNGSYGCNLVCRYCWHLGTTGDMTIESDSSGSNDVVFSHGRSIRWHSPEYIVTMAKHLYDTYAIDFISFIDENLMTMDKWSGGTWLTEISERWIAAGLQPTCRRDNVPHDETCRGVHWNGTSHARMHRPEVLSKMYEAGCASLVYGLESFDAGILKKLGKGVTRQDNIDSIGVCLSSGIRPIPNIIIGFPEESFSTVRHTIEAMIELGITAKPHFATPYPGSEWFYTYMESILSQYDGDLEKYILDLGDATKITAVITHRFAHMELLGLQEIVYQKNLRALDASERHWADAGTYMQPLAMPRDSFNFRAKKLKAPVNGQLNKERGKPRV